MSLPELVRRLVDARLGAFCESRVPAYVRDRVRLVHTVRGNSVTLVEERPRLQHPEEWIDHPIAQLRYAPEDRRWTLYWRDRNRRWHRYSDLAPTPDLDDVIREIHEDPTGIFWG